MNEDFIMPTDDEFREKVNQIWEVVCGGPEKQGLVERIRNLERVIRWLGAVVTAVGALALASAWQWIERIGK